MVSGSGDANGEQGTHAKVGPLAGIRVMLIDDELDTLDLLTLILSLEGAVVARHSDPQQLLEDWEQFSPDVLLSDIEMPRLDGHELLRRIRRRPNQGVEGGRVPAIAITADSSGFARTHALGAGFAELITKPTDMNDLVAAICSVVR